MVSLRQQLEALKREYYNSYIKDPNVLIQIQELERQLGAPREQMNSANYNMNSGMNKGNSYMNNFQPLHQPESSMPYAQNQQQQPQCSIHPCHNRIQDLATVPRMV